MRRLIVPIVAMLALTAPACIKVEDFGSSWDAATIDPELVGDWTNVDPANIPGTSPDPKTLRFAITQGSLLVQMNREIMTGDEPPFQARTVVVGNRRLLLFGETPGFGGLAMSYTITGGILRAYWINGNTAGDVLKARRPKATSITLLEDMGRIVVIKRLDEEALQILGEMTDAKYWMQWAVYKR